MTIPVEQFKAAILEAAATAGVTIADLHLLGETDEVPPEERNINEAVAIGYVSSDSTMRQFAELLGLTNVFSRPHFYHEMGGGKFEGRIVDRDEGVKFVWEYERFEDRFPDSDAWWVGKDIDA